LKAKRRVVRSLKDRIRANFNVSVSEVDAQDKWQRAVVGIACIGSDKQHINGTLSRIADLVTGIPDNRVITTKMEIW